MASTLQTKLEEAVGQPRAEASFDDLETLPELLSWRVAATPDLEAYRQFDAGAGRWLSHSWSEIDEQIQAWRHALEAERLAHGDRVAILVPNGIEHVAMDQAALSRGLVPVPLHAIDNPESIIYILNDSGAVLLLIDSAERWGKLIATGDRLDGLKRVVCLQGDHTTGSKDSDRRVVSLERWLDTGRARSSDSAAARVKATDLAAIVYTSGTTGRPKGVMLSHGNVMANLRAVRERISAEFERRVPLVPAAVAHVRAHRGLLLSDRHGRLRGVCPLDAAAAGGPQDGCADGARVGAAHLRAGLRQDHGATLIHVLAGADPVRPDARRRRPPLRRAAGTQGPAAARPGRLARPEALSSPTRSPPSSAGACAWRSAAARPSPRP